MVGAELPAASPPPDALPTIFELMPRVMASVGAVGKEGWNDQQKFRYRGIDQLLNALHGPLSEHGVSIVPEVLERVDDERTTKGGSANYVVRLRVSYRFFGPAGDHVQCVVWGEAADTGDKATSKAMSAALKYALVQTFCVPTADLDDADSATPEESEPRSRAPQRAGTTRRRPPAPVVSAPPPDEEVPGRRRGGDGASAPLPEEPKRPPIIIDTAAPPGEEEPIPITRQFFNAIQKRKRELDVSDDAWHRAIFKLFEKTSSKELTAAEARTFLDHLNDEEGWVVKGMRLITAQERGAADGGQGDAEPEQEGNQ